MSQNDVTWSFLEFKNAAERLLPPRSRGPLRVKETLYITPAQQVPVIDMRDNIQSIIRRPTQPTDTNSSSPRFGASISP